MKKVLILICFYISLLETNAQSHNLLKDSLDVKFNDGSNYNKSKTPVIKIPNDSNVHYHMNYKKLDVTNSVSMPNARNQSQLLQINTAPHFNEFDVRPAPKADFLCDSLIHIQDATRKRVEDKNIGR